MTQDNLKEIVRNKLLNSLSNSNSPYSDLKIKEMLFRLENPDFVKKLNKYKSLITKGDLTLKSIEQNILGDLNNEKSTLLFQEENADNAKAFYEALKGKYSKKQIAALMALSHQETAKGGNKYVKGNVWDPNKIQEGEQGGIVNRGLYSFEEGVNNFKNKKSHEKPTSYWYQDWINTEEGSKYTNPYLSQTEFYINNFLTRTDKKKALKKIFDNPNATIEQITEALHAAQKSKSENLSSVIEKAKFLYDNFPKNSLPKKEDKREVIEPKSKKLNFDFMRPILGGNRDIIPYRNNEEYKYGGNLKYKENEVYDLSESEINKLLKDGYELEYL
jgi:hypothetical protein